MNALIFLQSRISCLFFSFEVERCEKSHSTTSAINLYPSWMLNLAQAQGKEILHFHWMLYCKILRLTGIWMTLLCNTCAMHIVHANLTQTHWWTEILNALHSCFEQGDTNPAIVGC